MFKNVGYAGFDGYPELRAAAERASSVLADEVGNEWHDQIEIGWEAYPDHPAAIELTIVLELPIGTGVGTRLIPNSEFNDRDLLRARCRAAWDRALGALLEKRKKVWEELLRQPAEV